uniref:Uncharacterized protein n=1 Tax=Knipowitschia caucasica TaxID=637954 RepID=A0AAV2KEK0_KNICA
MQHRDCSIRSREVGQESPRRGLHHGFTPGPVPLRLSPLYLSYATSERVLFPVRSGAQALSLRLDSASEPLVEEAHSEDEDITELQQQCVREGSH